MYYLTHIKADGSIHTTSQEATPTLGELRKAVGGHIGSVPFWDRMGPRRAWVICNGEGKLEGLPVNEKATAMWYLDAPQMSGVDVLVGDILVIAVDTDAEFRRL